nr:YeeE/YedE thiosulfate transporter family protein [uncultured Niameybacter sp.]
MKNYNWIKSALFLGFAFFLAIFMVKPVGVSTQFSVVSGIVHSVVEPSVITPDESRESGYKSTNAYYDKSDGQLAGHIKNPWNYDFIFVLAIPLGAYIMYKLKNKKQNSKIENIEAISNLPKAKQNFIKTYLPSFIGGFLLLFGARMADGCTSGHMMSGMMQGSVSGYIFAGAVFIVAIPVALLVEAYTKRKVGQ